MPIPKWEERWPGRLDFEFQALRDAGIPFDRNEAAWEKGILKLRLQLDIHGREVPATATFPDLYPDFRVRVDAASLDLSHHQSPFGGNLCLLGRRGDQWQPSMTLAHLLGEPLRRVLATGKSGADPATHNWEDPQAEPYSAYYEYFPGSAVFVDGSWEIPAEIRSGTLLCGLLLPGRIANVELKDGSSFPVVRCAVLEVRGPDGGVIVEADPAFREIYPSTFEARWYRRDAPLDAEQPRPAFAEAEAVLPRQLVTTWPSVPAEIGTAKLVGILFPEETGHRRTGEGWVFGLLHERKVKTKKQGRRGRRSGDGTTSRAFYARPVYAGRGDLSLRIPSLHPLRDKTMAAFGLGSLGAPAALEFARGGVGELRILDGDFVDAGPTVRWPLGLPTVGANKALTLHQLLREHYPYTHVRSYPYYLGHPPGNRPSDEATLNEMLEGASLVFDATAELDTQRLLSRIARERGIPYVSVNGKPGGWGGMVFRHLPGVTGGCHECLLWSLQEGGPIPNPPSDDATGVQPRGCGDVTFTGTSFDMTTLALEGVRKAVGTLAAPEGGYPDGDWDVAVVSLRSPDGSMRPPHWEVFKLDPDPRCRLCRSA